MIRRVEEMAKELEALRSLRQDNAIQGSTESYSVPDTQDSPEHPPELSETAVLDETDLGDENFELEDFVIDRDTVVDIFKMYVQSAGLTGLSSKLTIVS
jgi:hypothetical protein